MEEELSPSDLVETPSKGGGGVLRQWLEHYLRLLTSRKQWVGFASQSFFHNPYLAAADMFFVHPGAAHGALSRCFANAWSMLGATGCYSHGRDKLFKRLGLVKTDTFWGSMGAILADTIYGFTLSLPGCIANYGLSGCGWPSILLGVKASGAACWTSFIAGALFDSFAALDSDDPAKRARAPAWVQRAVLDRFALKTRKKLIWAALAASLAATAAIYCFAPGGLLNSNY